MKRDILLWIAAALLAMVCGLSAYAFQELATEVKELRSTVLALDKTINETNLLLRANGIGWPEPIRRVINEESPD